MEIVTTRWWELKVAWACCSGEQRLLPASHFYWEICICAQPGPTFIRISLKSHRAGLLYLRGIGLVWPWWCQIRPTIAGFTRPRTLSGTSNNVCTQAIYTRILFEKSELAHPLCPRHAHFYGYLLPGVNLCFSLWERTQTPLLHLSKLHSITNQFSYILTFFTECSCCSLLE